MRFLVAVTIFLLVVLLASDSVSAKNSVREQSGKKKRSAVLEETNYSEDRACSTDHHEKIHHIENHDKSRNRKRRSVDEIHLERSSPEDTSKSARRSEEGNENSKESRLTEKRENVKSEETDFRSKNKILKDDSGDNPKRKFDLKTSPSQTKSRKSGSEEKKCQNHVEDLSDSAEYSEDTVPNRERPVEDSSVCSDCTISKTSSCESRSNKKNTKRKKNNGKNRDSSFEAKEDESVDQSHESEERNRMKVESEKWICEKNEISKKNGKRKENIEDSKDDDRADRKSEKIARCPKKQKRKNATKKSSVEKEEDVFTSSPIKEKSAKYNTKHQMDTLHISSRKIKESNTNKTPKNEHVEYEDEDEEEIPRPK